MNFNRSRIWLAVALVALVQSAVLVQMVWARASLLQSGQEVRLKVIPVDPRSLFRGDYVILNYDISRVPTRLLDGDVKRGQTLYVTIAKRGSGEVQVDSSQTDGQGDVKKWQAIAVSQSEPDSAGAAQFVLRGKAEYNARAREKGQLRVRYGIESYFIPEGTGRALEEKVRGGVIEAVIAIGEGGSTAIKALVVDGKKVSVQPLW